MGPQKRADTAVDMSESESQTAVTRRTRGTLMLWALAVLMGGLGLAAHVFIVDGWDPIARPTSISWWILAVLFGLSELAVINIQIRSDSHSLSVTEIPMVIGVLLAAPAALIVGRLVGSATALVFGRRQGVMKLAFNLGLFYLESVTVLIVFRAMLGSASPLGPAGWFAVLVGIVTMVLIGSIAVFSAISIHDPSRRTLALFRVIPISVSLSVGAALVGLVSVFALSVSAWTSVVLVASAVMILLALRSYGILVKRHDDLRSVHEYVRSGDLDGGDDPVYEIISGIATATKASSCALVTVTDDRLTVDRCSGPSQEFDTTGLSEFVAELENLPDASPVKPRTSMSAALDALEIECEYIVRIELEGSSVGLVVGPRMGVEEYGKAGEALIETLAASAAARLRRLELVDRLRAEVVEKQGIIQSKDQLIASVSHELRTPMTSVLGFADLLQGDAGDLTEEERLEMLQAIVDHSLDITNIVDDLLTVARSDTGSLIVRRQPVDLLDEAQVVVESRAIREVESIVVAGTSTLAIADPDRVRQVLRNLVVNAQRYGGGSVRVEVAKDVAAGYVRVIDNGPGVDVEQVEGIFEPYVRTQESLSQPASVGLGLTISRRLARLMGGDVTYRRAGGETTFELSVPIATSTKIAA